MITFIVLPLLFFIYGSAVAVNDVRQRILKQRVSAQGPVPYVAAKVLVVMAVAVASVLLCGALSLAAAPVLKGAFYPHAQFDFPFAVETPGGGNAILQMAFSAGTAIFFGLLGFFVGLATRVMLLPALLAGGLLMVAPFAGPYDPRNVLSVAAEGVFDFWGGFTPRALYPVSSGVGLLLMLIGFCIVAAACAVVWSRRTKFV